MIEIGSLRIDPPLWLAPMAGVTDRDFRLIVRRIGGIGVVTMEFISSKAIVSGNKRTREMMHFSAEERPLSIQIYGSDVATMREAALVVEELGADICDINMGCPANKVLKGCAGAALMGDLKLAESIVRTVRDAITIPLTVKFRLLAGSLAAHKSDQSSRELPSTFERRHRTRPSDADGPDLGVRRDQWQVT
jgi:tRNA-dihydrouridine synthase